MKERPVDRERAIVTHDESAKISQPGEGTLHRPAPLVAPEDPSILRRRAMTVRAVGRDQQDTAPT